mmetsp:Transcript_73856/g.124386  ORF Transcript_73856/g.124386 Transcript_73856/m.124386 type:complete len:109 (-) Transcript_73856:218-544(-)|eukprot:CAMPEP_0174380232 /NCGR_PEP_ID=MMETSP0811_2-20130205/123234_1 /TAXON_ID=73025 ORGANISM="Eutreptiella gymnastica-like, Strain CCMP1594" /NCGR_SAMPLE_ID=MMETSP0811_2 /ASSEMBLY_ACC=CAM_ASM_000667 /LENGTH=108 /DNA_ID=CAMNT_0015533021 /DNA_START=126 /DNA_END=452 /DNA_ORIENTATION=-
MNAVEVPPESPTSTLWLCVTRGHAEPSGLLLPGRLMSFTHKTHSPILPPLSLHGKSAPPNGIHQSAQCPVQYTKLSSHANNQEGVFNMAQPTKRRPQLKPARDGTIRL